MKFLDKWMEPENILLSEDQSQNNTHANALTDKWILAQKLGIPKIQVTDHMKLKEKEVQKCGCFGSSEKGNKIHTEKIWR